jgi:hypothetical protein
MLLGCIEPSHRATYRDRYGTQSLNVRGSDASYVALVPIVKHLKSITYSREIAGEATINLTYRHCATRVTQ